MSNRDDQGGRPPPDDRTLLDPLSSDELEALRQARQRLQAQRKTASSPPAEAKRQVVIGPEEDETMGHAPTRAMPALPSFDGKVSLDEIGPEPRSRVSGAAVDPASSPRGPAPSEPMSIYSGTVGEEPTVAPADPMRGPPSAAPKSGATGFGENTLMWMQPPKPQAPTPSMATADVLAPPSAKASALAGLRTFAIVAAIVVLVAGMAATMLLGGANGVVELHTNPSGATVTIDGKLQSERTPVKLTMGEGPHTIVLALEGYVTQSVEVTVDAEKPGREDVLLVPRSATGLLTSIINVGPVPATITVDGAKHESVRDLAVPNLDPAKPHTILIEAPGYKKIQKDVEGGALKASYNYILQPDPSARP